MHKFDYRWKLADANFTKDKGKATFQGNNRITFAK